MAHLEFFYRFIAFYDCEKVPTYDSIDKSDQFGSGPNQIHIALQIYVNMIYFRENCKVALILKSNYTFAPDFLTLHDE